MNEEATSEAQAAPETPESSDPPPSTTTGGRGLPAWLPYFFLVVVPAVIVGVLVFVFAGGGSSGGDSNGAAILEMFFAPAEDSNTKVDSFKGEMPPDFPEAFPLFDNSEPVASFAVATPQGKTFTAVLTSSSAANEIFAFYSDKLDTDPWQVEIGQSGTQIIGIRFARPDDPDVSGVVIVNESELGEQTLIQIVYEDLAGALTPGTGPSVPLLGESRPLPIGFPETVPIYDADETLVIDSGFQRGQGGQLFFVTFLTLDSQDDVVEFYRDEFESQGWTVVDSTSTDVTSFAVRIEFDDGGESVSGQVTADTYAEDADYTQVVVELQLSGRSGN